MENFQTYENPEKIGHGAHGDVYRISDNYVAKIFEDREDLERELDISNNLFESGISVPKPEGIFTIKNFNKWSPKTPGFVMEFIEEFNPRKLEGEYDHVKGLLELEIIKSKEKGFVPGFDWKWNYLYDLRKDRVYLIDFSIWRKI